MEYPIQLMTGLCLQQMAKLCESANCVMYVCVVEKVIIYSPKQGMCSDAVHTLDSFNLQYSITKLLSGCFCCDPIYLTS